MANIAEVNAKQHGGAHNENSN